MYSYKFHSQFYGGLSKCELYSFDLKCIRLSDFIFNIVLVGVAPISISRMCDKGKGNENFEGLQISKGHTG